MLKKWLLVCATRPEWGQLKNLFSWKAASKTEWTFPFFECSSSEESAGKRLGLAQIGVGCARASKNFSLLVEKTERPDLVIHFGLSGGLVPQMGPGRLILAERFLQQEKDEIIQDEALISKARFLLEKGSAPWSQGALLSSERVLKNKDEKSEAGTRWNAVAVDMETYPVAQICRERAIPYLSLRAVFDPLEWDLEDLDACEALDSSGEVKPLRLAKGILSQPRLLMHLPRYQSAASRGNKALAGFLLSAIKEW